MRQKFAKHIHKVR